MADSAVLHSREPLHRAELVRVLSALRQALDRVDELVVEEAALLELPDSGLPDPERFHDCLIAFSIAGYLPRGVDARGALAAVLEHDFSRVADVVTRSASLALDVDDEDEDGIDLLEIHATLGQLGFAMGVTGAVSAEARAQAYERVIGAANLPLRLLRGEAARFEHSRGLSLHMHETGSEFPPEFVHCSLEPEPVGRSIERLFAALQATGVPLREASWRVATGVPRRAVARVEESYRTLVAARFPARHYRGSMDVLPTVPYGIEVIAALEPVAGETSDQLVGEGCLGHNQISVLVRPVAGGHRVILVGTHSLDVSLLERRLGVAWVPSQGT